MPTSSQTPSSVCSESKRLEISPSLHSPGKISAKVHENPSLAKTTITGGKSAAEGSSGVESGFMGAPNTRKGKR